MLATVAQLTMRTVTAISGERLSRVWKGLEAALLAGACIVEAARTVGEEAVLDFLDFLHSAEPAAPVRDCARSTATSRLRWQVRLTARDCWLAHGVLGNHCENVPAPETRFS